MIEIERVVIGSIFIDPELFIEASSILSPEDFAIERNADVFRAMQSCTHPDIPSVAAALKLPVAELTGYIGGVTGTNIADYCQVVRESAKRRAFEKTLFKALTQLQEGLDLTEAIASVSRGISDATNGDLSERGIEEMAFSALQHLYERKNGSHDCLVDYGLRSLDVACGGIRPEYTIIAGRPGQGKSALVRQIAHHAINKGVKTTIFTPEMTGEQVFNLMWALDTNIPFSKIYRPSQLTDSDMKEISAATDRFIHLPLVVDDTTSLDVHRLCGRARRHIQDGAKLIVVDYIQLLRGKEREIRLLTNEVSAALRDLSKSEKVAVIALSQLRRVQNENERPTLSDLKESGNLEQDALNVFLLYRPKQDGQFTGEDELIIAKQRFGDSGISLPITFDRKRICFSERYR